MKFGARTTAEQVTEGLDLAGRTYLVTGCNSGLGRETVRVLALRGAQILGLARTVDKAEATLAELGVEGRGIACDLGDLDSVSAAVEAVAQGPKLDGLIANAGIMALPAVTRIRGIEAQFAINHLGHFKLVTALLGRLTPRGRVVVLSSGAHRMAPEAGIDLDDLGCERSYSPWSAYGQSKLANLLFARSLSRRIGPRQTANSVHPGVVHTHLGRHVEDREAMHERMKSSLKTVEAGAATQCYVATHPRLNALSGLYFSDCKKARTVHAKAEDDELAEALWAASEELAG